MLYDFLIFQQTATLAEVHKTTLKINDGMTEDWHKKFLKQ